MAANLLDVGVSRRALSIARMIDRLPPGKFNIVLIKADNEGERWQIQIDQPVTLQKKDLHHETETAIGVTVDKSVFIKGGSILPEIKRIFKDADQHT